MHLNIGIKLQLIVAKPFWVWSCLSSLKLGKRADPSLIPHHITHILSSIFSILLLSFLLLLTGFCWGHQLEVLPPGCFKNWIGQSKSFSRHEHFQQKVSWSPPVILTLPKQQSCSLAAKMERTQIDETTEVGKASVKYQKENSTTMKKAQNRTDLTYG